MGYSAKKGALYRVYIYKTIKLFLCYYLLKLLLTIAIVFLCFKVFQSF